MSDNLDPTGCETADMAEVYKPGTMKLYPSGRYVDPFALSPDDIELRDIAHALARINRFNGHHAADGYSVAIHSLRCAELAQDGARRESRALRGDVLACLLHDAAETFIGDMIRPIKHRPEAAFFRGLEHAIERVIEQRFGLWIVGNPWVKEMDDAILARELRERDDPTLRWPAPNDAASAFLAMAHGLGAR